MTIRDWLLGVIDECCTGPGWVIGFIEGNRAVLESLTQDDKRAVWQAMKGRAGA